MSAKTVLWHLFDLNFVKNLKLQFQSHFWTLRFQFDEKVYLVINAVLWKYITTAVFFQQTLIISHLQKHTHTHIYRHTHTQQ